MATPSTMILRSLQLLGEKALGDTLTSDEQTAYLAALNSMMESWSIESLMVYQVLTETFSLVAGTSSYTIGSGGTFNTVRPTKIVGALIRNSQNADSGVDILGADAYRRIVIKTSNGNSYPSNLYYDYADAAGLGTIYLYPQPQAGLTLVLDSWKQLQTFGAISTTVVLPMGYERAIIYNLAIELAGGYIEPSPTVVKIARESKGNIKRLNTPDMSMTLNPGIITRYRRSNIFAGP